jgi:flagellar motor switch protein FliN/FliY
MTRRRSKLAEPREVPRNFVENSETLAEVVSGFFMEPGKVTLNGSQLKPLAEIEIDPSAPGYYESGVSITKGGSGNLSSLWPETSVLGFVGKIMGEEVDNLDNDSKDAFGELMNQLWGRLRLSYGKDAGEPVDFSQPEITPLENVEQAKELHYSHALPSTLEVGEGKYPFLFLFDEEALSWMDSLEAPPGEAVATTGEEGAAPPPGDDEAVTGVPVEKDYFKVSQEKMELILDIRLPAIVSLGKAEMPIKEILKLGPGSVIELNKAEDEPVELLIGDKVIATGEVVIAGTNFALRVKEVVSRMERIRRLRK